MNEHKGSEPPGSPPAQQQQWPGKTETMRPKPDHGEASYRGLGRLEGKVALITGADSGIGRAVAIAFAREGADVAFAYYNEHEDAKETLKWIHDAQRKGRSLAADLTQAQQCRQIVKATVDTFGRIDVLVNNAAFQCAETEFENLSESQIERTFRSNILAYIYVTQAALRYMPDGGSIVNTGSVTALDGHAMLIDYAATKAAIHNFTKSLAQTLAARNIRVNCVAPGPVWTPLIPSTFPEEKVEKFGSNTAWQRPAQPAEMAPSYVFLACSESRYYTGEILAPTGRSTTR